MLRMKPEPVMQFHPPKVERPQMHTTHEDILNKQLHEKDLPIHQHQVDTQPSIEGIAGSFHHQLVGVPVDFLPLLRTVAEFVSDVVEAAAPPSAAETVAEQNITWQFEHAPVVLT